MIKVTWAARAAEEAAFSAGAGLLYLRERTQQTPKKTPKKGSIRGARDCANGRDNGSSFPQARLAARAGGAAVGEGVAARE